ncbi:hypothetical protein OKW29_007122 [Paraburkholderia sp. CI3]
MPTQVLFLGIRKTTAKELPMPTLGERSLVRSASCSTPLIALHLDFWPRRVVRQARVFRFNTDEI